MKNIKKIRSVNVSEELWERFQMTVKILNEGTYSETLESLLHDYVTKNTAKINEKVLRYSKNNITK